MPSCPHCGYDNTFGTLICARCNALLAELRADEYDTNPATTTILDTQALRPQTLARHVASLSEESVALYINDMPDALIIQFTQQATLGRYSPDATVQPLIDLAPYGAFEKGVSRLHAVIRRTNAEITMEDLGSTNGTWVNGAQLQSHVPYLLKSGNRLRLGQLELEIHFRD